MARLYIDNDKYGEQAASAVVDAYHSAIKDLVRRRLDEVGGDWASFVFDKSYDLIGAKEFAGVEKKLLATGHRFDEELGTFEDPIRAIVEDVERLRADLHLAHRDKIRGFMYDLVANTVTEIPLSA